MPSITFNGNQNINKIYFYDDSAGTYTYIGDNNDAVDYFPDNAVVGDCIVFCAGGSGVNSGEAFTKFQGLNFDVATQLVADAITVVWEYAKIPATNPTWTALADVVDNTNSFQNAGANSVVWTMPEDWENYIYPTGLIIYPWVIRCRITAVTNLTEGGKQAVTALTAKDYTIRAEGYTEGAPVTLQDIYDADVSGGWGLVTKSERSYTFNCGLQIDSGCYFETKQEIIQFLKNWDMRIYGVIKSGEVVVGDKCKNGSLFIFNLYNTSLYAGILAYTNAEIYNTQYRYVKMTGSGGIHGHWGGWLGALSGQKIYDVYGEGLRQFRFVYDGNVIMGIKGFGMFVENPGAILKNITCYGAQYSVRTSPINNGDYMHDSDFSGATLSPINPYRVTNSDGQVMDFIDCNWGTFIDTEKIYWTNQVGVATYYPTYYETYSILLKIIDKDNNGISGVIVDLENTNGTEIFNFTTNADGYPGQESGTVSSATASTLVDSSKSWTSDEWWFQEIYITSGKGIGQRRIIKKGNTATELQVAPDWDTTPDNTSKYVIIPYVRVMMFEPISLGTTSTWSTVTDYNPFVLTLSLKGYETYGKKFTLDKKADWQIKLYRSPYATRIGR